jgi:hypothetical protein
MRPELLTLLEWSGAVVGLASTLLLALNTKLPQRISRWSWIGYLISNVLLIALMIGLGRSGLLMLQIGFLCTSLLGICCAFIFPPPQDECDTAMVLRWLEQRNLVAMPAGVDFKPRLPAGSLPTTSRS